MFAMLLCIWSPQFYTESSSLASSFLCHILLKERCFRNLGERPALFAIVCPLADSLVMTKFECVLELQKYLGAVA